MGLRSSRDQDTDLFVPITHTDCMMKSFLLKESTDWNNLPIHSRKSSDLSFRTDLLKYFNIWYLHIRKPMLDSNFP